MILKENKDQISKNELEENGTLKSKNKLDQLKTMIVKYSLESTAQGYPKIFESKILLVKLIWILIFLGSSGGTAYFVVKGIIDYFQYEVVTKIRVISEVPSVFPTVTICDNNAFTSVASDMLIKNISYNIYN